MRCPKALLASLEWLEIVCSLILSFADFDVDGYWPHHVQHPVQSAKHVAQCDSMVVFVSLFFLKRRVRIRKNK